MNRDVLLGQAAALLDRYKLTDWKIEFRKGTGNWLGRCVYWARTILINDYYAEHNSEAEVLDTLLHEIAHALTPGHSHDKVWKAVARSLGAIPKACSNDNVIIRPGKYQATCPSCGRKFHKYRRPKYRCGSFDVSPYYCSYPTCGKERGRLVFILHAETTTLS